MDSPGDGDFNSWVVGENVCRIFRLVDKGYVRQMKLFNFTNCGEIELSGKLEVSTSCMELSFWLKLFICFFKKLPLCHQKNSLPCIKQTEFQIDWRIKLNVSKKILDEFRKKEYRLETIRRTLFSYILFTLFHICSIYVYLEYNK